MKVTTIPRPDRLPPPEPPVPCERCGERTIAATRYEATGAVAVRWCLDGCLRETPPFRQTRPATRMRRCVWCGEPFGVTTRNPQQRACSFTCANKHADAGRQRRHDGRFGRVRRPA